MATQEIQGYDYIAVLYIPVLELELPVMDQWDYTRLTVAPCRYTGSIYSNDLVIAGHAYEPHFWPSITCLSEMRCFLQIWVGTDFAILFLRSKHWKTLLLGIW